MQTANIMLALGGDKGTTVPKYAITCAEIAVLQAIHGNDAVFDIEPNEDVDRTSREEIARLAGIYGLAKMNGPTGEVPVVASLFPGAAARVHQSLDELGLDESLFKAERRMKPAPVAPVEEEAAAPKKRGKKKADEPAPALEQDDDDGVQDMDDANSKVFE